MSLERSRFKTTDVLALKRKALHKSLLSSEKYKQIFSFTKKRKDTKDYKNNLKKLDLNFDKWGLSLFYGSDYVVQGVLTENNKVLNKVFVYIYHSITGVLVARTLTDDSGVFIFNHLSPDTTYYIVASDPKGIYNTVTLDGIRLDSRKDYIQDVG